MITYEQLRNKVKNWEKFPGCEKIPRSSLLNPGFPGRFNLSFAEDPWLKKFRRSTDFPEDYHFSTIQSCIRNEDIKNLTKENSFKYLGVFEMADLNGILAFKEKPNYKNLLNWQIQELLKFFNELGIENSQIFPSYCKGGNIKELSKDKYNFDFYVPEDSITSKTFLSNKIPKENLIPDETRNTFLSYRQISGKKNPWGFRNEIHINIGTKDNPILLDVTTIEYILWEPILTEDKNVSGIKEINYGFQCAGIGLERLCMATNKLKRVQDVDYIKPFYDTMEKCTQERDYIAGENLRALHRAISDIKPNQQTGKSRRDLISQMIKKVPFNEQTIEKLLYTHTENQPWHENLEEGIKPTIERIIHNRKFSKKQ